MDAWGCRCRHPPSTTRGSPPCVCVSCCHVNGQLGLQTELFSGGFEYELLMVPGHRVPWILSVVVEETPPHHHEGHAQTFCNLGLLPAVVNLPLVGPALELLSPDSPRLAWERERRRAGGRKASDLELRAIGAHRASTG